MVVFSTEIADNYSSVDLDNRSGQVSDIAIEQSSSKTTIGVRSQWLGLTGHDKLLSDS